MNTEALAVLSAIVGTWTWMIMDMLKHVFPPPEKPASHRFIDWLYKLLYYDPFAHITAGVIAFISAWIAALIGDALGVTEIGDWRHGAVVGWIIATNIHHWMKRRNDDKLPKD